MFKSLVENLSLKWFFGLMALFIVTLCVSIIYHLPVSWLLAQSASTLPSWAEMLRKQSPTVAVLNHRGVW